MSERSSWSPADLNLPIRTSSGSTPTLSSTPRRKVPAQRHVTGWHEAGCCMYTDCRHVHDIAAANGYLLEMLRLWYLVAMVTLKDEQMGRDSRS